jgi:hypothetical protein
MASPPSTYRALEHEHSKELSTHNNPDHHIGGNRSHHFRAGPGEN